MIRAKTQEAALHLQIEFVDENLRQHFRNLYERWVYHLYSQENDTLSGIAGTLSGVTLSSSSGNGFTQSTKIYPGMVIKIKKAQ